MKKAFAFILLIVFFVGSTGFTVNLHYCMNKFHSWGFGSAERDKCGQCGMNVQKAKGCCHDEVKTYKLEQDLSQAFILQYKIAVPYLASTSSEYFFEPLGNGMVSLNNLHHIPPLINGRETYLLNRVFRI